MTLYTTASGQKVTIPEDDTTGERLLQAEGLLRVIVRTVERGENLTPAALAHIRTLTPAPLPPGEHLVDDHPHPWRHPLDHTMREGLTMW
jgi:hypothetical protein